MESPINPAVWRYLFHGTVAALSTAALFSLFHERYRTLSCLDDLFRDVRAGQTPHETSAALLSILSKLKEDAAAKRGTSRLAALRHGGVIVRCAALSKDGANAASVCVALKLIVRVFGADSAGPAALCRAGGFRVLLATLSEAHRQGLQELMDEAAAALLALTQVRDADVVLEADVPPGAEGAQALAKMPATVKMLRVLDPNGSILFLSALTGIFANVCALRDGAVAVGGGVGGRGGVSYFLSLLEHNNIGVVGNCMLAVRYLARAGIGHAELAEEANLARVADNFRANGDPRITNSILSVILVMFDSPHGAKFFDCLVNKTSMLRSMFEVWCNAGDKTVRDRSRLLVQLLTRVPQCEAAVQSYLERFRVQIADRRSKDEEELRRQNMQQMRQQQMMQQMMMGGMGGGMDMSELMGE